MQPPSPALPGRAILTTAAAALRHCTAGGAPAGALPGPVHLNMQLREPLAPVRVPWPAQPFLAGLARWAAPPYAPFTRALHTPPLPPFVGAQPLAAAPAAPPAPYPSADAAPALPPQPAAPPAPPPSDPRGLAALLAGAPTGLVVVGELAEPGDAVSAAHIARALGWPVAADILSGLRLGGSFAPSSGSGGGGGGGGGVAVVGHMDHVLLMDRR